MIRKFLVIATSIVCLTSCGSGDEKAGGVKKEDPSVSSASNLSDNPDYQKGLTLVGQNGCLSCHAVADKINGPSYQEIANKYAGMPDSIVGHLAKKIIEGGSGVWGEIPMIPHPTVSQQDAEAMVKYVLLLKK